MANLSKWSELRKCELDAYKSSYLAHYACSNNHQNFWFYTKYLIHWVSGLFQWHNGWGNKTFRVVSYFLVFCNTFLYTQLAFAFHLLRASYIFHDHILSFCFFLLQEDCDAFHEHINTFSSERFWYLSQAFSEKRLVLT